MNERRLSVVAVILTFLLLIAGGLVHSTGSGLACPDWPLCKGQFFPQMVGGVEFEHSHRLVALAVSVATFGLLVLIWQRRKNERTLKQLSLFAFFLVLFQAALGALTVIYKLPPLIKAGHLATSMLFFSTIVSLSYLLYRDRWFSNVPSESFREALSKTRPLIIATTLTIYAQIVVGTLVRHTGAGGVCPAIPFCENEIWPAGAHPAIRLHAAHRLLGLAAATLILTSCAVLTQRLKRNGDSGPLHRLLRNLALAAPNLVVIQIVLGYVSVAMNLALVPITAHLALAAVLLALFVILWISCPKSEGQKSMTGDLISLTKARLSSFVLVVTMISYALGPTHTDHPLAKSLWLLGGMILLTAGAAFLNCYFERDVDAQMERTRDRPLAAGRLQPRWVLYLGALMGLAGVPTLTIMVNPLTGFLGAIAYVSYAFIYTPLKARTSLSALVGAIPGALPPLIGWTASSGQIDAVGVTLFFILFFWQLPHFLAIAIYRKSEYGQAGIQVLPLAQGEPLTRRLMLRYTVLLIPVSLLLSPLGIAGRVYFYTALILGLTYAGFALYGQRASADERWAKRVFLYSLVYLPTLFLTLLLDARF